MLESPLKETNGSIVLRLGSALQNHVIDPYATDLSLLGSCLGLRTNSPFIRALHCYDNYDCIPSSSDMIGRSPSPAPRSGEGTRIAANQNSTEVLLSSLRLWSAPA
jgi:hypothetical protein